MFLDGREQTDRGKIMLRSAPISTRADEHEEVPIGYWTRSHTYLASLVNSAQCVRLRDRRERQRRPANYARALFSDPHPLALFRKLGSVSTC